MNITEAKQVLREKGAEFEEASYPTEKEYWRHICPFYYYEYASDIPVRALTVPCKNGKRHIELQFLERDGEYYFRELYFGTFCFELGEFHEPGQDPEAELMQHLDSLIAGRYTVLSAADLKRGRLVFDGFRPDMREDTKTAFLQKMSRADSIIGRLNKSSFFYELYDAESIVSGEFSSIGRFWKASRIFTEAGGGEVPEE